MGISFQQKFGLLWIVTAALVASASFASSSVPSSTGQSSSVLPENLKDVQIEDRLGNQVEIQGLQFRDEAGNSVPLSTYFNRGRPVVLALVYYECPNLCTLVLSGLLETLKAFDWVPGEKFEVLSVSINPKETAELATTKKNNYLKEYGKPEAAKGWHFLTGEEEQIRALADQVGFRYKYVEEEQQYAHGAALFVLTPDGRLSRTLYGIQYAPKDFKLALLEASEGKIGTVVERFLLFCYSYDPVTRKYSVTLTRVMQAGGLASTLLFGGYLAIFWYRQRRPKKAEERSDEASAT